MPGRSHAAGAASSASPTIGGDPHTAPSSRGRTPRHDARMSPEVEPQHSVLLVVGREQFTPPTTFGGATCTASADCIAVGVRSVDDGPTAVSISPQPGGEAMVWLGEFTVETEGLLSVRSVYNREYDAMGVPPGLAQVTIWGDADTEPTQVIVQVTTVEETWLDSP